MILLSASKEARRDATRNFASGWTGKRASERATSPRNVRLHGTTLSRAVKNLELGEDDLSDERVRLERQLVPIKVSFEDLDARTMHQISVVQDEKVVVEDAKRVSLEGKKKTKSRLYD